VRCQIAASLAETIVGPTSEAHYNAEADGPALGLLLAAQAAAALWLLTAKSEKA